MNMVQCAVAFKESLNYLTSESAGRGRTHSGDTSTHQPDSRRYSSQESLDEPARERVTYSEPRMVDVCPAMRKLTLETKHRALSESSLAVSSGEDDTGKNKTVDGLFTF